MSEDQTIPQAILDLHRRVKTLEAIQQLTEGIQILQSMPRPENTPTKHDANMCTFGELEIGDEFSLKYFIGSIPPWRKIGPAEAYDGTKSWFLHAETTVMRMHPHPPENSRPEVAESGMKSECNALWHQMDHADHSPFCPYCGEASKPSPKQPNPPHNYTL